MSVRIISRDDRSGIPPEKFSPERFLPGAVAETAIDPLEYVFGFGRRICPGKAMGLNSVMLICSALLRIFEIEPIRDENGCEVPPQLKSTPGMIRFATCSFKTVSLD
jgi:cytochrome P450